MTTTLPRTLCNAARALALQTLALLVPACSDSHSPQAGDTATSWLRSCVDDGDCDGTGRCIAHVCTLPCAGASDVCAELAVAARCLAEPQGDGSMCDLVCEGSPDCAVLGSGYTCQDGQCRVESAARLASQSFALEGAADEPELWDTTFPLVVWAGDRWRIAHVAWRRFQNLGGSGVRLLSDVYADGTVRAEAAPSVGEPPAERTAPRPSVMGPDGTLLVRFENGDPFDPAPAHYRFVLPGSERRPELSYARAELTPLPEGGDWLVLSRDDGGRLSLGRYNPREERWSVAEREISVSVAEDEFAGLTIVGDDVLLMLERDANIAVVTRALGLAAREAVGFELDGRLRDVGGSQLRTSADGFLSWAVLQGGWVHAEWFEGTYYGPNNENYITSRPLAFSQQPTAFRMSADGALERAVQFRLSTNKQAELLATTGVPERDAIAFCHVEASDPDDTGERRTSLLFSLFDATGRRIAGPTLLAASTNMLRGCQLTWSGAALLATWLEEQELGRAQLYARIVSVP